MSAEFQFTVGNDGPPPGQYQAAFDRAEAYRENLENYGEGVRLIWRILAGDHAGEEASRIVSRKVGKGSNLVKFAGMLNGGPLAKGQAFDLMGFRGRQGILLIEETQGGATRVASFIAQAAAPAQGNGQAIANPQASAQAQAAAPAMPQASQGGERLPWEGDQ